MPNADHNRQVASEREIGEALLKQRRLLTDLTKSEALMRGDVAAAIAQVTEVATNILQVERASVWTVRDGGARIECVNLFERSRGVHSSGNVLREAEFPSYFRALGEQRTIAAADASADPRTSEFLESYLAPLGIGAMLDAPVFVRGEMVAVVCHEHVGPARRWHFWEELIAGTVADFVALVIETAERNEAATLLEEHGRHLEDLVQVRSRALRESEETFRALFAVAPVAMALTSLQGGTLIMANERAMEIFGVASEVLGKPAPQFWVRPEDREELVRRVKAEGRVEDFSAELQRIDGGIFWARITAELTSLRGEQVLFVGVQDVTRQREIEQQLRDLAVKDPLTGIYNRRHFFTAADEELARARRYGRPLSLAILDADHFKQVNDRYGHGAGDEVLKRLADGCGEAIRTSDLLARYGGEEFVILMPETELAAAIAVIDRLRGRVEEMQIETTAGIVPITVSAGVTTLQDGDDLKTMLQRADDALYSAKDAGRNRVSTAPRAHAS
jgi:diguanylate cyclase (GGDEF)-like protein/PAS domain S-box-containing protein